MDLSKKYRGQLEVLAMLGFTGATVSFSGGNDSGGADTVALFKDNDRTEIASPHLVPADAFAKLIKDETGVLTGNNLDLFEFLAQPVYDEYGTFASGGEMVSGEYDYDVANMVVNLDDGEWSELDEDEDGEWSELDEDDAVDQPAEER